MAPKPFPSGHVLAAADVNDLTGVTVRAPTEVDVVSTTTETALVLQSIVASAMSTDRMLRLTLGGDILQNAGATPTIRVYFRDNGGGVMWQTALSLAGDADRRPWSLTLTVQNINSASVQRLYGTLAIGDATPAAVGLGSGAAVVTVPFGGTGTANSALTCEFKVTLQWDTNSANASWRKRLGALELL